ncbi:hypothetical protein L195_g041721, partial [Trifolium pratense]
EIIDAFNTRKAKTAKKGDTKKKVRLTADDLVSLPQVPTSLCNVHGIGPNFVVDVGRYRHFDAANKRE